MAAFSVAQFDSVGGYVVGQSLAVSALYALLAMLCAYSFYALLAGKCQRPVSSSKSKAILITGCDSGIGRAVAKNLLDTTSYSLILTFLNTPQADQRQSASEGYLEFERLAADSDRLHLLPLNLTDDRSIQAVADYVADTRKKNLGTKNGFTSLWALVNNAGVLFFGEFDWITNKQIDLVFTVNVTGPMKLTKALLPHIVACRGARVVNVSSVGDASIFPGMSVYDSSKAAVSLFTQNLRLELQKFGCYTVTFRPAIFATITNIFDHNKAASTAMWSEMSDDKRRMYGKYFDWWYNKRTLDKSKNTHSIDSWDSSPMFGDMKRALMSTVPPIEIICASPFYWLLFTLQDSLTTRMRYFFSTLAMRRHKQRAKSLMDRDFVKAYQAQK